MSAVNPTEPDERKGVALACRILARAGLLEGILGHVSVRLDASRMLVRCRGPEEQGLLFSRPTDILEVPIGPLSPELAGGYRVPNELAIHTALYEARPAVGAVVHAHSRAAVLCGVGELDLAPVFGAYAIPSARLALDGIPTFPRAALIRRRDLAQELLAVMGEADVCLMRGHGITVCGDTLEQAVIRALDLHLLLEVRVQLATMGVDPRPISELDMAELPDLGGTFNERFVFAHHAALDAAAGGDADNGAATAR